MKARESPSGVVARTMVNAVLQRVRRWYRADRAEDRYLADAADLADLERRQRALERGRGTPLLVTTFNF